MGLLNKLTGGRAGTQTPARADGPGSAGNEVDGNGNARRLIETRKPIKTGTPAKNPAPATPVRDSPKEAGIPPLKQPTLPPGRSAILILCSKDRRPYWHVFKRSPSTELGWEFERHLPAVPKKPGERSSSTEISTKSPQQAGPEEDGLNIGGRNWGQWRCPGCGQQQHVVSNGFTHLKPCRCGANVCLGPGREEDATSTCPNCAQIVGTNGPAGLNPIAGVHGAEQKTSRAPSLESPNRRELG